MPVTPVGGLKKTDWNDVLIHKGKESIKVQLSDLERVGELGYVEGISNIIVKNLKEIRF